MYMKNSGSVCVYVCATTLYFGSSYWYNKRVEAATHLEVIFHEPYKFHISATFLCPKSNVVYKPLHHFYQHIFNWQWVCFHVRNEQILTKRRYKKCWCWGVMFNIWQLITLIIWEHAFLFYSNITLKIFIVPGSGFRWV